MTSNIELGIDTFGDVTFDAEGRPLHQAQVIRNVVAEAVLADELGLRYRCCIGSTTTKHAGRDLVRDDMTVDVDRLTSILKSLTTAGSSL